MTNERLKEIIDLVIEGIQERVDCFFICNVIKNDITVSSPEREYMLKRFHESFNDIPQKFKDHEGWANPTSGGAAWWAGEEKQERIKYLEYLKSKL